MLSNANYEQCFENYDWKAANKDYEELFPPAHISQAFCHQLYTHSYYDGMHCVTLYDTCIHIFFGPTAQVSMSWKQVTHSHTSHVSLLSVRARTHARARTHTHTHTLHLSWLLFSAIEHCSLIKGNLFWLLVFLVLEMHPILLASSSKSLSKIGSCILMRTLSSTRWKWEPDIQNGKVQWIKEQLLCSYECMLVH